MNANHVGRKPVEIPHDVVPSPTPAGPRDFLPEVHAARKTLTMARLFGEEMSKKTASTADARQKRGS